MSKQPRKYLLLSITEKPQDRTLIIKAP